jgi:hypothetical protein
MGQCHCGAVAFTFDDTPDAATKCNCSICRKLGATWIYTHPKNVQFTQGMNSNVEYKWGEENLSFHSCATCGATTHWSLNAEDPQKIAVNLNLIDPAKVAHIPVRRFDGANTWTFID